MKRTFKEIRKDITLIFLRRLVYIWMFIDARTKCKLNDGITFNRKEPYVMIANHTFMFDVVHVPLRFKKVPFIVASRTLFNKPGLGFVLKHIAHAIPKSKGSSDTKTVRGLLTAVKKGYPILIFPEGDTTFFGETNYIEESTYKLIKKLKLDVITCNVKGGYLSKPRWATGKRKNRRIELNYSVAIKKDELKSMTLEEIETRCKEYLYNNDYEYQREKMIPHPGDKLAEGFENATYICPECESINTLSSKGNEITCSSCNTVGTINDFGFIEGFKFDNLIDWDKFQRKFIPKLRNTIMKTTGDLYYADYDTGINNSVGRVNIEFNDGKFIFTGSLNETINLRDIFNPIVTLRRNLNFTYKDRNFFIRLDSKIASFLRVAQEKY